MITLLGVSKSWLTITKAWGWWVVRMAVTVQTRRGKLVQKFST